MRALIVDPATSTGYCVVDIVQDKATIIEYGYIEVNTSSDYQGDHCLDLIARVEVLLEQHSIQKAAIEDYFFSSRFANGSNVNAAYRTALHILFRQKKIPYTILNVSAWKTFIAGRSTPTKEQKKRWGAQAAKKLHIQQALWERYNFRFPNHSLSEKTGKPIHFRFDIVDVVGQAVYYCRMILGVKDIEMTVVSPSDVIFKKNNKKQFIYPKE